jgi:L-lactate utilization protein LutC
MPDDALFETLRAALGRKRFQKPSTPPEPELAIRNWTGEERLQQFRRAFTGRGGHLHVVSSAEEARSLIGDLQAGQEAIAASLPWLAECGILDLAGVQSGFTDAELLRNAGRTARIGIISCHCLLAESGTVVLRSSPEQPGSIGFGLPVTVIVAPRRKLLGNLDELLQMNPRSFASFRETVLLNGSEGRDIHLILI